MAGLHHLLERPTGGAMLPGCWQTTAAALIQLVHSTAERSCMGGDPSGFEDSFVSYSPSTPILV